MATAGMKERILNEITQMRPMGELINVIVAEGMVPVRTKLITTSDPVLDAWRGARLFSSELREEFLKVSIKKEDYDECGTVVCKAPHFISNWS